MDQPKLIVAILVGLAIAGGLFILMSSTHTPNGNAQPENTSTSQHTQEEADEYFNNGDWENAALAYDEISEREPENNVAWYRLGTSLRNLERYEAAIPAYESALEHGFFNLQVMLDLARTYSLMDDNDSAITWLQQATDAGLGVPQLLENDANLAGVREDPRFEEVLLAANRNAQPCEYDERYRQWDFWLGEWNVYNAQGNLVGTNTIEKIANGCALLENWVSANGAPGNSINYYDTAEDVWRQYWVSNNGGMIPQQGEYRDGAMHMEGRNIAPDGSYELFRGTWTPLEDGRVRQFLEQSNDNGESWYTWFDGYYERHESTEESADSQSSESHEMAEAPEPEEAAETAQCTSEESRQFDFWVGEWNLTWDETDSFPASTGTNIISRELGSCVIEENFSAPEFGFYGKSVSTFDANANKWKQTWVDNSGGYLDFVGELESDGRMILFREIQDANDERIIQRMVFYDIEEDSLEWNWERSDDGGETWTVLWNIHYERAN